MQEMGGETGLPPPPPSSGAPRRRGHKIVGEDRRRQDCGVSLHFDLRRGRCSKQRRAFVHIFATCQEHSNDATDFLLAGQVLTVVYLLYKKSSYSRRLTGTRSLRPLNGMETAALPTLTILTVWPILKKKRKKKSRKHFLSYEIHIC